jgi:putative ABC transport system permease protein
MKFVDLLKTAVASTFRSKLRTTLTVIAIFIGAFTLTLTSAVGTGISSYINTQVATLGATNVMFVTKTSDATSTSTAPKKYSASTSASSTQGSTGPGAGAGSGSVLSTSDISKLRTVPGLLTVSPSIRVSPDYVQYGTNGKYQLSLSSSAAFAKADLATGKQLSSSTGSNQILLPKAYLKSLGFDSAAGSLGKQVTIGITDYVGQQHTVTATVVGVENATLLGSDPAANGALTKALQHAQAEGKPSAITTNYASATVTFKNGSNAAQVAHLKSELKADGYTGETVADQLGSFETVINGIVGVLDAFAVIALLAAGFGIINTLLMSVQERTREIGLMKAMGMGGGRIYALFSLEAIFIGFLGSAIGAGAAIGVGSAISAGLSNTVLKSLPGLHLLQFAASSVITIILVVMFIAFVAGTLPARRASRQNPIDALRYE